MRMNTRQWLERLTAFDTTSRLSNLGLIETVRDALAAQGLSPWLAANAEGSKANLFCTLPAQNGDTQGGIALSGHTDVVPVDGQDWASDPFVLTDKGDGRLYARGACDMKGFIAAALALVPEFLAMPRAKPLHLALSYDEEVGCVGAPRMLQQVQARGIQIDGCVVGEPTSMKPVVAHKGINVYRCRVHGRAAHSSLTPQGCNALPLVHHPADGGDGGTPERPRFPPPAGAPVGAVGAKAAALLHAARRGGAEHGAAHFLAGHWPKPAIPQPRCGAGRQGGPAYRRSGLYPPLRLQPQ